MKNRHELTALLLTGLLLLAPSTAFAGAWTQPDGDYYAKIWGTALFGEAAFGLDGDTVPTESYRLITLSAYGEYGLSDDLTLVGKATPIGAATHGDESNPFVGTFLAGLRQRFVDGPVQLALEMRAGGAPGFGGRDLAPEADYDFRPTVQTAQFESELQIGIAMPIGWFSMSLGPRFNSAFEDEVIGFAQVGVGPFGGFVIDLHTTFNEPLDELETLNVTGAGNTRYLGFGLGLSWWPTDAVGFHAGFDGAVYAQSNAETAPILLGVEFRTP